MEDLILLDILRKKGILNDKEIREIHKESSYLIPSSGEDSDKAEKFDEKTAKEKVSKMYHSEGGRKYVGEKYSLATAKEMVDRYKSVLPTSITCYDMYVALNEHYHNYCSLFKSWFGESIDMKIVESAIVYWFKDDDWNDGCKIWKHFEE